MPAQKRVYVPTEDDPLPPDHDSSNERPEDGDAEESDRSPSFSEGDKDEFVTVKLSDIRREVQCPICLGIIKKTRTVMECLHRFCRECIDKSMRLGNNECPACRTHCASRRSLRDDPNYDALIAALYPDIDKYEEEELAFHEEEKARNKQIQSSIAQTLQRQSEALCRKRPKHMRRLSFKGRKNYRNSIENPGFGDIEDVNDNDVSKDSSSADERIERKPKKCRRGGPVRFSQSFLATGADGGGSENDFEVNKETLGASVGLVGSSETLAWGRGGMRSHTRHGSMNSVNSKISKTSRLTKLVDYVRNSESKSKELDIHLMLVSLDESRIPALHRPYICCRPSVTIGFLCQYIALQTTLPVDVVEMYVVKDLQAKHNPLTSGIVVDQSKDKMQILNEQETLANLEIQSLPCGYLLLAYQKKG